MIESIPREERIMIGADFNRHDGEGDRGNEHVWCQRKEPGIEF